MYVLTLALSAMALFAVAYFLYGRLLARVFQVDNRRVTPAHAVNDGVDYVPTRVSALLPQHFSAIAAAGPIVGPILAGLWFGWLPALLWIVFGNIFIGAMHDFASLMVSLRHRARSITEVVREEMGNRAYLLFLTFVWISLMYVITAFTDLTASTFTAKEVGGGVASASFLYLLLSIAMGIAMTRFRCPLWIATAVALPLLALIIWSSQYLPVVLPASLASNPNKGWDLLILVYCALASVLPIWLLLQPRGYLGGYFLYAALGVGLLGLLFGGYTVEYPAYVGYTNPKGAPLFPILFITVACGACSGFHGLVCSGTSSKQLAQEDDAHTIGYGGMLLEGLVALVALATIMIFAPGDPALAKGPTEIYANGLARFAHLLGVPIGVAVSFGLLAFATFVYDTLDVATRLGRYIFQELTGWQGQPGRIVGTVATLAVPLYFLMTTQDAAYLTFWPLFGASNQLLAALSLLGISVWMIKRDRNPLYTVLPMLFILIMTLWALARFTQPWLQNGGMPDLNGGIAALLIGLTFFLFMEAFRVIIRHRRARGEAPATPIPSE